MNSKQLKSVHRKIYEDFFQQHEIILSCPHTVNLVWDVMWNNLSLIIKQKIPLRFYIWISLWGKEIEFCKATYFNAMTNQFVSQPIQGSGFHFIGADECKELSKIFNHLKVKVDVLSECSPWLAISNSDMILTLLSLLYVDKQITQEALYSCKSKPINDELHHEEWIINNLLKKYLYLVHTRAWAVWRSWFWSIETSFFDWERPIIWFRDSKINRHDSTDNMQFRNIYGFRIEDLWPEIKHKKTIPYDWSIIHTGKFFVSQYVWWSHQQNLKYNIAKQELYKIFQSYLWNIHSEKKPSFFRELLEPPIDYIGNLYAKLSWSHTIEVLYTLKELLWYNYSEESLTYLIRKLNKYNFTNDLINWGHSEDFIKLMEDIRLYIHGTNSNVAIFPEDTIVYWWCINIVTPLEQSRQKIEDYCNGNKNVSLIYTSRHDGMESEGIVLEQDLNNNTHSEFSQNTNYKVINWDQSVFLRNYQSAIEEKYNDILIDMAKNKIHIQGKICTSKDLHSQSVTCEILSRLIKNNVKKISSKDLSPSSYTKNKNEMITKVINPLVKIIQQRFNRVITVSCNWSVANYSIEFDFKDLKIWLLEELLSK